MCRGVLAPRLNFVIVAGRGHTKRRHGQMDQPDGLDWRVQFPGLRVGIGELSVAMAAAFLAGGFVVSLVAGGSAADPLAAMTGAQNPTVDEDSRPAAGITSSPGRPAATRELLVDDLRPVHAPGSGAVLTRELLVDDFVPAQ
jgi:hypothetical protein